MPSNFLQYILPKAQLSVMPGYTTYVLKIHSRNDVAISPEQFIVKFNGEKKDSNTIRFLYLSPYLQAIQNRQTLLIIFKLDRFDILNTVQFVSIERKVVKWNIESVELYLPKLWHQNCYKNQEKIEVVESRELVVKMTQSEFNAAEWTVDSITEDDCFTQDGPDNIDETEM
ncbi:hypothetical protein ACOME3_005096 [Neoechinorhynchus agilis]